MEYCAVLAQPEGRRNFLVAILPRNQAVELCRQCTEAAQRLVEAGLLPLSVSHRILDIPVAFPFFAVEERSWNRNFFSFHQKDAVMPAVLKAMPLKREVIVYKINAPFSFPPLNDFMNNIPHELVEEDRNIEEWLNECGSAKIVRRRA